MVFISYNVNGIRAAAKKGLLNWVPATGADCVGLQEVKAESHQIDCAEIEQAGYFIYWNSADKKGYSGVAVFTKQEPLEVERSIGDTELDAEGRVLILHYPHTLVINAYFPAGSNEQRMLAKIRFLHVMEEKLHQLEKHKKSIVFMGDLNIALTNKDVFNPVYAENSAGFTSGERYWLLQLLESGYCDTFRHLHPDSGSFSWWSYMANARARNLGWRIDYILAKGAIVKHLSRSQLLQDAKHSDHCPVRTEFSLYSM